MIPRLFGRKSQDYAYAQKCISIVSKQLKKDRENLTLPKKENYFKIFCSIEKFVKDGTFTANETHKILRQKVGLEYLLQNAGIFLDVSNLQQFKNNEPLQSREHNYEEIDDGELMTLPDYDTFCQLPKEKKRAEERSPSTSQSKFKQNLSTTPEIETFTSGKFQIVNINKYLKHNFDFKSLQKMDDREKLEALNNFAQSLDVQICNFNGEAFTLEYFLLEEQLTNTINALTKIKCQDNRGFDDDNALTQKKEAISYVRNLLRILESCEENDEDDE